MLLNNHMIFDLEKAMTLKSQIDNRYVSEGNKIHMTILENKLFGVQSVILLYKVTNKNVYLQYCCPITEEQLEQLQRADHVPALRSGKHLSVGCDTFMGNHYAFASIHFPLDTHAIDFITAFEYIHKHLEQYLDVMIYDTVPD